MSTLPYGWVLTSLGEVSDYIQRGKSPKYVAKSALPVVNQKCVRWHGIEEEHLKFVDPSQWAAWGPERYLRPGDILWNSTGTGTIGRAAFYSGLSSYDRAVADSHVTVVRPSAEMEGRYIHYLIKAPAVQDRLEEMQNGSTNQVELSRDEVLSTEVPLPPISEQRRIVAKIGSLSAKSKRARNSIAQANSLIDGYKLAVIEAYLDRKYEDNYVHIAELCDSISDGDHQPPPVSANGISFITISTFNDGCLKLEKVTRHVPTSYYEGLRPQRRPAQGDVLFAVTGATIGLSAIVDCNTEFVFQRHIALLKPNKSKVMPELLLQIVRSKDVLRQMYSVATGTAQPTVPISALRQFRVRIPPLDEQASILRRIKSAHEWVDRLAAEATSARNLIDRLDQAVLAKAFRGELVPQNPAAEPASTLLKRIKAARDGTEPVGKRRGRPRKATPL